MASKFGSRKMMVADERLITGRRGSTQESSQVAANNSGEMDLIYAAS